MTGVPLAPCHDEFRGPRSDYVRQITLGIAALGYRDHEMACECCEEREMDKKKVIEKPGLSQLSNILEMIEGSTGEIAEPLPGPDEIGNLIEEVIDLAKQINLAVDSADIQKLLDSLA
ncbi:hypothetical protein TNCV_2141931 [Trichonephila clavipes]|uniref:Uncharacterized protein n=1 Tax=Trichonephila clavipes TaxID=2585209 RepID=A0A8X6S2F6_TRICX|nr:hypothetical protein TNCV_2141931 [Trichonephila clavipes]